MVVDSNSVRVSSNWCNDGMPPYDWNKDLLHCHYSPFITVCVLDFFIAAFWVCLKANVLIGTDGNISCGYPKPVGKEKYPQMKVTHCCNLFQVNTSQLFCMFRELFQTSSLEVVLEFCSTNRVLLSA